MSEFLVALCSSSKGGLKSGQMVLKTDDCDGDLHRALKANEAMWRGEPFERPTVTICPFTPRPNAAILLGLQTRGVVLVNVERELGGKRIDGEIWDFLFSGHEYVDKLGLDDKEIEHVFSLASRGEVSRVRLGSRGRVKRSRK